MRAIATLWTHQYDMASLKPVNTKITKELTLELPSDINKALMKTAIVGKESYEERFKAWLVDIGNTWRMSDTIGAQVRKACELNDDYENACKIILEFPDIGKKCYVMRDFFGHNNTNKFTSREALDSCK